MHSLNDEVEAMRRGTLLAGLAPELLALLLERAEMVELADGQCLFRQGETGDAAYLVVAGAVEVVVETPLGEVAMALLGPQQVVGEIAVFTDLPRTATVRSQGDTLLLRLERAQLADAIATHPETAFGLIGAMGRRIHALNQPLALLTLAAQALERGDGDTELLARIAEDSRDVGPFARSFQKIVEEMAGKQARVQELAVAARLQQSILPKPLTLPSGWELAAFMKPARDVGGDFYDWFPSGDGKVVVVVADVSGKGIPAAMFMAVSRTLIRASVLAGGSIETALSSANGQLEEENDEAMFVTVFLAELNLTSGTMRYVNAGHCDGCLRRADGDLVILGTTGPAVALRGGVSFRAETVAFQPGDLLLLSSDGVGEAFSVSEELFGDERLHRLLQDGPPRSAVETLAAVEQAVAAFAAGAPQSDDITCLALTRS